MRFTPSRLGGAFILEPQPHADERGLFLRTWCQRELEQLGLVACVVQCSLAFNHRAGTLRGMHYQAVPHQEVKIVRCTRGSVYDVIIDMRPDSPTYREHQGITLSADNRLQWYVPRGFAHGYLTLEDNAEVAYQMSDFFDPTAARGVRWNDPALAINWPGEVLVINDRDRLYEDLKS